MKMRVPFIFVCKIDTLIISGFWQNQGVFIALPDCNQSVEGSREMNKKRIITNTVRIPVLSYVFEEYQMKNKVRNLSAATIKGYQEAFERFINIIGNDIKCENVNAKLVDQFTVRVMDEGIKAASINHYLRCIRSFLYWCMGEGYVKQFKIHLIKEQETIKGTYSDMQIRLLVREPVKQASFVEWRCWALVCWFLATGNRAETVCSIKMKDLNFTISEIYINKTKTNQAMILPMSMELRQVLRKYISLYRMIALDEDFLFPNVGNNKLSTNAMKISIHHYNQKRGVSMTGIHAFRHTFAKNWIRNNGDVFRLQKILGHKTLEMTRRYVNMFQDDLKHDYEKFSSLDNIRNSGNSKQVVKRWDK